MRKCRVIADLERPPEHGSMRALARSVDDELMTRRSLWHVTAALMRDKTPQMCL